MQLEWVNHASFVIHTGSTHLITDPWIEGTAFNNGWRLMSPTKFRYEDFSRITHIWVSHEHPDHFSPPNLKRIPEEFRRRITFLFHWTKDKRVLRVCKSLGFKTEELPHGETMALAPGIDIVCGPQDLLDSWMAVMAEGKTLLNMNDCVFAEQKDLVAVKDCVGAVDVLASQFSYANWVGNPSDEASHQRHAERKRSEMCRQIRLFQPKWFIPCASYVYFSHVENFYMNQAVNRIGDVYRFVTGELDTPTVVLYPDDKWEVGEPWDSTPSIQRYDADFEAAKAQEPDKSPVVHLSKLQAVAASMVRKAEVKNNRLLLRALSPSVARLIDLGIDVELSYRDGLKQVTGKQPDIVISSDSLMYCMAYDWGGNTLEINGRYEVPSSGNIEQFFRIFRVSQHNSAGEALNLRFIGDKVLTKIRRKVRSST